MNFIFRTKILTNNKRRKFSVVDIFMSIQKKEVWKCVREINTYICRTWNQNFSRTIYNIFLFISDLLTVLRFYLKDEIRMRNIKIMLERNNFLYIHISSKVKFLPTNIRAPIKLAIEMKFAIVSQSY
jgi:hypothetical protein